MAPSDAHPALWVEVNARQAAEFAEILARACDCGTEAGLTGVALVRRYWPKRFLLLVVPASEPD